MGIDVSSAQKARAKDPRWLLALSGTPTPNDDGKPWCALCLRMDSDVDDDGQPVSLGETSMCAGGHHLFCWRCQVVCGGELLCEENRCPLCRLNANAAGLTAFSRIVQDSTMLRLPHPKPEYAGPKRLMLKDTISDEDRCEITTAIASDRCKELRESMRPKKGGETPRDDAFDPSDVGEVMRAFVEALPKQEDLPDGLCEDMAVVSNSSALLGRDLGPEIDSHQVVVRFNEYARAGLDDFERHVGRRTTCHVVSEQVIAEFMEDEKMLEALRKTPMTLWMPPMAWGNSTAYGRYVRLLLSNSEADGLELSERQRRQVVLLRPSVSFSMWKYFRPYGNRSSDFDGDSVDSDDADEARGRPLAGTTGFKFCLLAMGISNDVFLYGFEDDPRNKVDARGGHYFNPKHSQEEAYDIAWERKELRRYEADDHVRLVPSHK